jgi:DNA-binding transcriptional ArsR family regulator
MSKEIESNQIQEQKISDFKIRDEFVITTPEQILCMVHDKKQEILRFLIKQEYTIRELSRDADINPGTVKRHMIDLEALGFIKFVRQEKNKYGIFLKYYRAVSEKFIIKFELP